MEHALNAACLGIIDADCRIAYEADRQRGGVGPG